MKHKQEVLGKILFAQPRNDRQKKQLFSEEMHSDTFV
jgi:hypothetical protein